MQFLLIAYDGNDAESASRRSAAREAHVALGQEMIRSGNILFSTAILGEDEQPVGSMRVMQFDSHTELDKWLKIEPYVTSNVWQNLDVHRCRMGPAFEWVTLEAGSEAAEKDIKLD